MDPLPFTGERFTPECVREIWYEHYHRYALARTLVAGRRVLDVACGEGYGSALLAPVARDVVGLDIDEAAVRHARSRYGLLPNLRFEIGDAANLAWPDHSFDTVVSFETLEHLSAQEEMVAGLARVLTPGGFLLLSSPDRASYSDAIGHHNEFHVRELYRHELEELLARHFAVVRLYAQRLAFHSEIRALGEARGAALNQTLHADGRIDGHGFAPTYYLALCAQREADLPEMPTLALFADAGQSVYSHYHHEIRKNMQAGAVIAERDATIESLRDELEALKRAQAEYLAPARKTRSWFWPFG